MTLENEIGRKVCPILARRNPKALEFLAFQHPESGKQIVKGTLEPGEAPGNGALRELFEESGIKSNQKPLDLGKSGGIEPGQSWHFYLVPCPPLPNSWEHQCEDDGGQTLGFFWQPTNLYLENEWDRQFVRALRYAEQKIQKLSPAQLDQYCPMARPGIEAAISKLILEDMPKGSIDPSEIARSLAGSDEKQWRLLMKPIRRTAIEMAKQGELTILRKRKPVDPESFKGVYRIGKPVS